MRQYLVFRLLIIVVGFLLVTIHVTYLSPADRGDASYWLLTVLTVYATLATVSFLTFHRWVNRTSRHGPQVLVDFAFQALLIWSTGGVLSIFIPVLFVTLVSATAVASARGSLLLATLTTVFLSGTTVLYAFGVMPPTSSWSSWVFSGDSSSSIAAYLVISVLALYAVSLLGSKFSSGLRRIENLQEETLENMGEGLLAVDREGRVILLNGELQRMLRLPMVPVGKRRTLNEVLRDSEALRASPHARDELLDAFLAGRRPRLEVSVSDERGHARPLEVKVSSAHGDTGPLRFRVGLFSDLSLQREVEDKQKRIERLEELQRMALGLAHEVRNPLASIRGCVQEIHRVAESDSAQRRFARIVMDESDRLDKIIEDFQGYARLTPPTIVEVDLVQVIDTAAMLVTTRGEFAGRKLVWTPPTAPRVVLGDKSRLVQVVLNLGINALQATSAEHGRVGFEIASSLDSAIGPTWEIRVWDNGEGIAESDVGKVVSPFYTTKDSGSGLGLSIVDRIVEEHRGRLAIGASSEGGALIRVQLRAADRRGHQGAGTECLRDETVASAAVTV